MPNVSSPRPSPRWRASTSAGFAFVAVALCAHTTLSQPAPQPSRPEAAPVARASTAPRAPDRPAPLHIHVRGSAEILATAAAEPDGFTVRAELVDDAGSPIPRAQIAVRAVAPEDRHAPVRLISLQPCDAAGQPLTHGSSAGDFSAETDARGSLCLTGKAPARRVALALRFAGDALHDAFEVEVPIESEQEHLLRTMLRFEPPPEVLDLDRDAITITASLRFDRNDTSRQTGGARREGIALVLDDERGVNIAEAMTGGDGRARFEVKTAQLAAPGPGEIVARFGGKTTLSKASTSQPVVRRADVHVALTHALEGEDADSGFPVDVDVTTTRGPVSGGVVEIRRAGGGISETVGAGAVDHGHARVIVAFAPGGVESVSLLLRYVSAAPWYRAGPEVRCDVKLARPGIFREAALAIVVVAAAAWIVGGWRRAPKAPVAEGDAIVPAGPSGHAGVQILGPSNASGWRGLVTDAHEGTPIAGARLSIIAPTFQGDGIIAQTTSDARGAFELEASHRSDARLVVQSSLHSAYELALPPPSVLGVALVTRRRALLDRLVRWAKKHGAPFDAAPEPTPGHVRRAAARLESAQVEAWAGQVEAAAYGPDAIGEAAERQVSATEPRPIR